MIHDIRQVRFSDVRHELEGMLREHCGEVVPDVGVRQEPDFDGLAEMEKHGVLVLHVGYSGSRVVGYIFWVLGRSLEYKGLTVAQQGPWYVRPENRRSSLAIHLFKASLKDLRVRGIKLAEPHYYNTVDGPRLGRWFESFGAKPQMQTYLMNLEELD